MSERRPIWKKRTTFSKNRNVSVVLWPPGIYKDHPTPPSITLEEGSFDGEKWQNTHITLTLDKAPSVIQDLEIAYAKGLELQVEEEAPLEVPIPGKPADPIAYLKEMALSEMIYNVVYNPAKLAEIIRPKAEWASDEEVQGAVAQLIKENKIRPVFRGLDFQGYTKGTS